MPPMSMDLQCSHCTALLEDETTREILDELDRERTRRAELEAQVRELLEKDQKRQEETSREEGETMSISRKHYMALQTELKGYRDLIDAMTKERPAIAAALQASTRQRFFPSRVELHSVKPSPSLPLHVVRLMEIMPWDPRAEEYAFAKEELYEWQFYNKRKKTWKTELRTSPKMFRELPTEEPKPEAGINGGSNGNNNNNHRPFLAFFNQDSAPPTSCVLTNHRMTKLYNLQKGFPLPENGGTWQWVGGWRVEKRISLNEDLSGSSSGVSSSQATKKKHKRAVVDCDDEGWSYAKAARHFVHADSKDQCWDHADDNDDGKVTRMVRRRKWTRQRALIDYPHASEATRSFLSLMAQRMYANMAANKLSSQLVDTKVALTMVESLLVQCKDDTERQIHVLSKLLQTKSKAKVNSAADAKAIVVAASEAAKQMKETIEQALERTARDKNNGISSS
ncbi:expressed unknown protein [Seminavis robusta]|uniref:Uncharacterized protein n=1 Tax=Seminavis robusta TaxID=568900 RepID=A0A9N8EDY1_9STRA|nr:expressed unknown protein [Seminavis robusta]|eukprot:Sro1036_g234100.1 n/a (453) ;mRNA; f:36332-37690